MKEYFDRVTENFETLIINRGKNYGVVVISLDEYNALVMTPHEMSPEKNTHYQKYFWFRTFPNYPYKSTRRN